MTDQRQHAEAGPARPAGTPTRRRVLAGLGAGAAAVLAGCSGSSARPSYREGTVGDVNGSARNASEMSAASAVAQTTVDDTLTPLDAVDVRDHEYVLEDGYLGSTVQGTLANDGDDPLESVEVRVRVYDDRGRHLGRYVATTGDLEPGATWSFQVVLLEAPSDVASYELAALGRTA